MNYLYGIRLSIFDHNRNVKCCAVLFVAYVVGIYDVAVSRVAFVAVDVDVSIVFVSSGFAVVS